MFSSERTPLLQSGGSAPTPASARGAAAVEEASLISTSDRRLLFIGLWTLAFTASLDSTIVATLISVIGSDFKAMGSSAWIGTAYLLSVSCFTPVYGRLCDILGRRGSAILAGSLFSAGTIMCGFARSMPELILYRAFAGLGGGGLTVVSSVIVSDLVPMRNRGLYQGIGNIFFGLGAACGGPVGGFLADYFGWRSAFRLQGPVLALSVLVVSFKTPEPTSFVQNKAPLRQRIKSIDYLGSLFLVGFSGCLVLATSLKETQGLAWSDSKVWGLLVASAVSLFIFFVVELKVAIQPIMPIPLLKQRTPFFAATSNFVLAIVSFSALYNVPLYFTAVRQRSAGNAGLHLIPYSFSLAIGSVFAGWVMRKTGRYWWLQAAGGLCTIFAGCLLASWNFDTPEWLLFLSMAPAGFGFAIALTTSLIALFSSISREYIPVATGISYLFRTTGQVLGVSLSSSLAQSILEKNLRARIVGEGANEIIEKILSSTRAIRDLSPDLQLKATSAWALSLKVVFFCQLVGAFVMFLLLLGIGEHPLPSAIEASTPKRTDRDEQEA